MACPPHQILPALRGWQVPEDASPPARRGSPFPALPTEVRPPWSPPSSWTQSGIGYRRAPAIQRHPAFQTPPHRASYLRQQPSQQPPVSCGGRFLIGVSRPRDSNRYARSTARSRRCHRQGRFSVRCAAWVVVNAIAAAQHPSKTRLSLPRSILRCAISESHGTYDRHRQHLRRSFLCIEGNLDETDHHLFPTLV